MQTSSCIQYERWSNSLHSSSWRRRACAGATLGRQEPFHYYLSHHSVPCGPLSVFASFWNPVPRGACTLTTADLGPKLITPGGSQVTWVCSQSASRLSAPTCFAPAVEFWPGYSIALVKKKKKNVKCEYFICDSDAWPFRSPACCTTAPPLAFDRIHVYFIAMSQ